VIDLSIVVVSFETRALTLECLASIEVAQQELARPGGLALEVVVVDNGSRDGTAEALRAGFPFARLIALPRNLGFAAGCNLGLKEVQGRCVLLLNSDARVTAGALLACVRHLDRHPDVGALGPALVNPDGSVQSSVHNYPRLATELLPRALLQLLFPRRFPSRRSIGAEPVDVEAVRGAALFAPAWVLRRVGPLSEEFFFFLEETDWCWRVREAGLRVVHLPGARIAHLSGASSKRKAPGLARIEYHRSLYRFLRRYRGALPAALVFAVRLAKSAFYVATQAPLAALGPRHRARWRAHRDVLLWHLRGCPEAAGLRQLGAPASGAPGAGAAAVDPGAEPLPGRACDERDDLDARA
jgi:hypothetical protein